MQLLLLMEYIKISKNDYDTFHELLNAYYREGEDGDTPQEEIVQGNKNREIAKIENV